MVGIPKVMYDKYGYVNRSFYGDGIDVGKGRAVVTCLQAVLFFTDKDRLFDQTSITFAFIWIAILGTSVLGHHIYIAGLDIDVRILVQQL